MPGDMARETPARARAQTAYRGAVGQTQTRTVHITNARGDLVATTVHTTIDAVSDPELVERLYAGSLNAVRLDGQSAHEVAMPIVYHDPAAELLVLVLGEAHRHREIEERIQLLKRLREDDAPIPAYVKDFAVVFGGKGLRAYLESKAQQALATRVDSKETEKKKIELQNRETELERLRQELEHMRADLKRKQGEHEIGVAEFRRAQLELQRDRTELERMRAEARQRAIAAAVAVPAEPTTIGPPPTERPDDVTTKPISRQDVDDIETSMVAALPPAPESKPELDTDNQHRVDGHSNGARPTSFDEGEHTGEDATPLPPPQIDQTGSGLLQISIEVDDEPTGNSEMPAGSDPLTTQTADGPLDKDKWIDSVAKASTSTFAVVDGRARLALVAGEQIASGLTGNLDVRVLLHRLSSYPVVTMLVGPPAALRTPSPQQVVVLPLEIGAESDRAVLSMLAKKFELTVDIMQRGQSVRRVRLTAPLAENMAYIMRAADDHLRGIASDGESEASYPRARDLVLGAGYDLLGVEHAESAEFRDDKLTQLDTAQAVRRALAIARRFARPSREDYLVCARGYPLSRWRQLRRGVLERAVHWGIWMGSELAQIAVSEGLARSRRDLVLKLDAGFDTLRRDQAAFDIDADAADDNQKALNEEAKALGVELRRRSNGAIKSEDVSVVSGSIDGTPPKGISKAKTTDELLLLLDDKLQRVSAATELCDRGDPRAASAVVAAVKKMSRAEAVRILGKCVKFGPAAAPPLIEGLSSSKAFLRHGCALALALLRTEEGTHAVIDLLLTEPTEIWREVARAIGQIGPPALMPLAAHVGRLGDGVTPATQERVAWAMAHVGVRGGKNALDQMAAGQSVMAPIAKKALDLHANAARDEVRVRPGPQAGKDVTVNRAFSRRFFEALEADRPDVAQAALHDLEASGPLEVLDEADLIVEEDEEEAELDESDLIQT
jgi:HEAT repeat protein